MKMKKKAYRVHIIVDPDFGNRIREIPAGDPVWIVDTPQNRLAFEAVRRERPDTNHLIGLTSFKVDPTGLPEDWLISELHTIDLHHGDMSHDPPWSMVNVIGVGWNERIRAELAQFGFLKHHAELNEFTAMKETASTSLHPIAARRGKR